MERMTAANPHFIRCIKPNNEKVPDSISAAFVLLTGSCVLAIRACPKGIADLKNEVKLVSCLMKRIDHFCLHDAQELDFVNLKL